MAKSRSIPTDLLSDPDYMELDSDTQVILLLLVLAADDEGRGRAHTGMLARHFNKSPERIEHALAWLSDLDLVTCYVVGRHRYYQLLRWREWQTLSKPTPSRFPAPPTEQSSWLSDLPRETQESPGESWVEGEGEGKGKGREQNPEEKGEGEGELPAGIMRFPHSASSVEHIRRAPHSSTSTPPPGGNDVSQPEAHCASVPPVQQVARILQLPVTEALTHLVTEYTTFGSLALVGEAHAAREWIEDTTRNRNQKPMSVAFFRRWLKRERDMLEQRRQTAQALPVGRLDATGRATPHPDKRLHQPPCEERRLPSLMHLAEHDRKLQEAIQARKAEC